VHDEECVKERALGDRRLLDVVADVDAGVLRHAGVLPQAVLAGTSDAVGALGKVQGAGHGVSFLCCGQALSKARNCSRSALFAAADRRVGAESMRSRVYTCWGALMILRVGPTS